MNTDTNTQHTPGPCYHKSTSAGQSLIIEESTGRNIAVSYDEKDGPLLAAAPDLLAALQEAERVIRFAAQEAQGKVKAEIVGGWKHHANLARQAITKATHN
jgi:hypothetical protein